MKQSEKVNEIIKDVRFTLQVKRRSWYLEFHLSNYVGGEYLRMPRQGVRSVVVEERAVLGLDIGGRAKEDLVDQPSPAGSASFGRFTAVWGERGIEGMNGKEGGLDGCLMDRRQGTLGEIPDEWQSVWQANKVGPVGVLEMAPGSTVERDALDDPGQ